MNFICCLKNHQKADHWNILSPRQSSVREIFQVTAHIDAESPWTPGGLVSRIPQPSALGHRRRREGASFGQMPSIRLIAVSTLPSKSSNGIVETLNIRPGCEFDRRNRTLRGH
jgi:hypothetical protein